MHSNSRPQIINQGLWIGIPNAVVWLWQFLDEDRYMIYLPSWIPEYSTRNPKLSTVESDVILNAPFEGEITTENMSHVPQYSAKNLYVFSCT